MTKAYLIDPVARAVTLIQYAGFADLREILGCVTVGVGESFGENSTFIDDNGLFRPANDFWRFSRGFQPLPHRAVLAGPDIEDGLGHQIPGPPTVPIEIVRDSIEWLGRQDFEAWMHRHRDVPALTINGETIQTFGELLAEMPAAPERVPGSRRMYFDVGLEVTLRVRVGIDPDVAEPDEDWGLLAYEAATTLVERHLPPLVKVTAMNVTETTQTQDPGEPA